jgi:hypothetical protein
LAKLRLNRSVRAVYHECIRRRLIAGGGAQNLIPSRARFAAAKLPPEAFDHPHFVRDDLLPLPLPPALPAASIMPIDARLSSEGMDEMKFALDAWSDVEQEGRAKSMLTINPLARQMREIEELRRLEEEEQRDKGRSAAAAAAAAAAGSNAQSISENTPTPTPDTPRGMISSPPPKPSVHIEAAAPPPKVDRASSSRRHTVEASAGVPPIGPVRAVEAPVADDDLSAQAHRQHKQKTAAAAAAANANAAERHAQSQPSTSRASSKDQSKQSSSSKQPSTSRQATKDRQQPTAEMMAAMQSVAQAQQRATAKQQEKESHKSSRKSHAQPPR